MIADKNRMAFSQCASILSSLLKKLYRKDERGYRQKPISSLGFDRDPCKFYMVFLSREIDIKLCQVYTKIDPYKILYKNSRFKRIIFSKYTTNLNTTISQRSLRNLGLLLLFKLKKFHL